MKLLWTKSSLPLSKLIRWGLKEPTSHFVIVFDDKLAFHSNLSGTHIEWYNTFQKHCEIVYEINYPLPLDKEEEVYQNILNSYNEKSYDYPGFLYFIWRGILFRFFNKPFPTKNPWGKEDSYLCTELATTLPEWLIPELKQIEDFSLMSPYKLYCIVKKDVV